MLLLRPVSNASRPAHSARPFWGHPTRFAFTVRVGLVPYSLAYTLDSLVRVSRRDGGLSCNTSIGRGKVVHKRQQRRTNQRSKLGWNINLRSPCGFYPCIAPLPIKLSSVDLTVGIHNCPTLGVVPNCSPFPA